MIECQGKLNFCRGTQNVRFCLTRKGGELYLCEPCRWRFGKYKYIDPLEVIVPRDRFDTLIKLGYGYNEEDYDKKYKNDPPTSFRRVFIWFRISYGFHTSFAVRVKDNKREGHCFSMSKYTYSGDYHSNYKEFYESEKLCNIACLDKLIEILQKNRYSLPKDWSFIKR
ncbi:MAG: hypothetical protein AABY15_03285 [Nanoarchaeota archaeon]